jgi:hypothetical protein
MAETLYDLSSRKTIDRQTAATTALCTSVIEQSNLRAEIAVRVIVDLPTRVARRMDLWAIFAA